MRRVLAALAVAITTAALALGVPSSGTASARPNQAADGARLTLLDQPISVAPDGDFPVFLQIDGAPEATEIAVDIFDAVQPGEIVGIEPEGGGEATFPVVALTPANGDEPRTTAFTIEVYPDGAPNPDPAWGWQIDEPGVYPVRVRLLDPDGDRLQVLMTSLIRLPEADQQVPQTEAALLVGVHRPPPEGPEGRAEATEADQQLLDELEPILDVLDDRPDLPATFSITPDTLARVASDDQAASDLRRLRSELDGDDRTVLDAPYVDVDAASLVQADLASNLTLQRDFGRQTLSDLLEPPMAGTWQLRDRIDEPTLTELRSRSVTRTLLPGDALANGAGVLAPVDLPAGGGTIRAVSVSDAYALGLDPADDPVLAAHRLLARLSATGAGPTGNPAVVVAIDPAAAVPSSLQIVADALAFGSPFFAATDVASVLGAPVEPARAQMAEPIQPVLGTYPLIYRRSEAGLASYQSMVGGRSELIRPYELTLTVSAAADLSLPQRQADAASVRADLQTAFTSIDIPSKDKVTLGASDAQFPLPIDSALDYPVEVVIQVEANDRVEFPNDRIKRTLEPGSTVVNIRVKTRTAGDTPVRITVRSPDDGVILAESQYTIRSTAVSGVGIILTGGAALFLAVWWGRHWRRARAARSAD